MFRLAMKKIYAFLAIALFVSLSFSICGDSKSTYLLAVVGNKGELLKVNIDSFKGDDVLINLSVPYGLDTQRSIIYSKEFVKSYTGKECGFKVSIPSLYELTGPSAGAMFALQFYEIVTDNPPLKSYLITGGVSQTGEIIPVGGVYEKINAFLSSDKEVMLFPVSRVEFDLLAMDKIKKNNKEGYPIRSVREAIDFLFYGNEINYSYDYALLKDVENKSKYNSSMVYDNALFYLREMKQLKGFLPESYKKYVDDSIEREEKLLRKGYYYTVANDAFDKLSYVRAYLNVKSGKSDLKKLEECLDSVEFYEERETNFEYIAGAKARYYRALSTYKSILEEGEEELYFEKIAREAEIEKAYLWCKLAKSLNKEGKGKYVDNSYLEYSIKSLNLSKADLDEEMRMLLEDKEYLAFLYEYAFKKEGDETLRENYSSQWAKVYASQAEYFKNKGEDYSSLSRISNNLEDLFNELEFKEKEKINNEVLDLNTIYYLIAFLGGVLVCMLVRLLRR